MATALHNVTFATIYQGEGEGAYNYSIPQATLKKWQHGEEFPNSTPYTESELTAIDEDLQTILNEIMSHNPTEGREAIYTAGAPGAGKSTLLTQRLSVLNTKDTHYAFNDPDEQCLKNMEKTYQTTIKVATKALLEALGEEGKLTEEGKLPKESEKEIMQQAYTKWRAASNYITHMIQGYLISHGLNFAFGTTAQSDKTHLGFRHLHDHGYNIRLIYLTTDEQVRYQSVLAHPFLHTTEEDVRDKALAMPPRLGDTFLPHTEVVEFHYRGTPGGPVHAATFTKETGLLEIFDQPAYQAVATWHNTYKAEDLEPFEATMGRFVKETRVIGS